MLEAPYPELDDLLEMMGEAGKHLAEIEASEGAAGNISVCLRWQVEPRNHFPWINEIELPQPIPELSGVTFLVSGSGRRLREILDEPTASIACIVVDEGGRTGKLYTSPHRRFERVTSEFNSHLAAHHDQMRVRDVNIHAIVHAQPLHLTYLSHLAEYQDKEYLNRHLLRWQPETILNFPDGIGVLPFILIGSAQLTVETMLALREHPLVIWSQHGVMARADGSILHALDLIEYAETAAHYEFLNLTSGGRSQGLAPEHLREVAKSWNIRQNIF